MIEFKPPKRIPSSSTKKIFLAGSIEQGKAEKWQSKVVQSLVDYDVLILNPRRDDWDPTWTDNNRNLVNQIKWELSGLDQSDLIFFYFDPKTISPITLLEFGRYMGQLNKEFIVVCPHGYFRKTNVVVTTKYVTFGNTKVLNTLDQGIDVLQKWCKKHTNFLLKH